MVSGSGLGENNYGVVRFVIRYEDKEGEQVTKELPTKRKSTRTNAKQFGNLSE
jgi:hypothetical protein